jgi:FKBP-type peptidyl-prolyl cis-trans isomerase
MAQQNFILMDSGLRYLDFEKGIGAIAESGKIVVVHLIGWLDDNGAQGLKFISTYDRGKPVAFKLGTAKVMKAWNEGVRGMKAGGKRRLLVPAKLGYGKKGVAEIVPPNTDLVFDVELLEVR